MKVADLGFEFNPELFGVQQLLRADVDASEIAVFIRKMTTIKPDIAEKLAEYFDPDGETEFILRVVRRKAGRPISSARRLAIGEAVQQMIDEGEKTDYAALMIGKRFNIGPSAAKKCLSLYQSYLSDIKD